jgi:hypothetical protein
MTVSAVSSNQTVVRGFDWFGAVYTVQCMADNAGWCGLVARFVWFNTSFL